MKKATISLFLMLNAVGFCFCAERYTSPVKSKNPPVTEILITDDGPVQGVVSDDGTVDIFAGIPFAAPPVGDLRWKEPQNVAPWKDVLKADHFAPMAMQTEDGPLFHALFNMYTHSKNDRTYRGPMSEDCLYLNVWKPTSATTEDRLPVLVYIHGGSLTSGQSWYEKYDGTNLAKEGIVVVTVAYRVGVFGYLADEELAKESPNGTTGNYGLLDQIKALEWVNKNIWLFGGDKDNITIAGESAGSSSVNAICASPLAKGLFRRAIGESSSVVQKVPPHTFRTMQEALSTGRKIKEEFGCSSIEELRKVPAEKLLGTRYRNSSMTVDGYALPKTPYEIYEAGENHEEALLNGFNAKEGFGFAFFTKVTKNNLEQILEPTFGEKSAEAVAAQNIKNNRQAKAYYNDVYSAVCFTYPHDCWTRTVAAQGKPVYEYFFSKENGEIGTNHSGEMIYAYRNVPRTRNYKQSDYQLEKVMSSYWLNFIKTGNPNGMDTDGNPLPVWETFQAKGQLMELGENCIMREDPFKEIYGYLKK